jgi:hypothetical protein
MAAQSKEAGSSRGFFELVRDTVTGSIRRVVLVIRPWLVKLDEWVSRMLQFLKFETDEKLRKPSIYTAYNNPVQLISKFRQCRRSLASTVTGVVSNSVITGVLPMFLPAVLLNGWQLVVASIDYHRARCEMKRRAKRNPTYTGYIKLYDTKYDAMVDILLGCMLKLLVLFMTWNIIGLDSIVSGFLDQAASEVLTASLTTHCDAQLTVDGFILPPPPPKPTLGLHDRLLEKSLALGKAEEARNFAFNGIGDQIGVALNKLTQYTINNDTNWTGLANALTLVPRPEQVKMVAQVGTVGAAAELTQVLSVGMEKLGQKLTDVLLKPVKGGRLQ